VRKAAFYPTFDDFSLTKENRITGIVSLVFIESNPSDELLASIEAVGFAKDKLIGRHKLIREVEGKY
jgi:hypothetical protein